VIGTLAIAHQVRTAIKSVEASRVMWWECRGAPVFVVGGILVLLAGIGRGRSVIYGWWMQSRTSREKDNNRGGESLAGELRVNIYSLVRIQGLDM